MVKEEKFINGQNGQDPNHRFSDEEDMPGPEDDASGLKLTKRHLYASEESEDIKQRQEELHRLGITKRPPYDLEEAGDTLASTQYKNVTLLRAKRTAKILRFSGFLVALIFLIIWGVIAFVWYRAQETVTDEQVSLIIDAPMVFTSGEEIIYRVNYRNDSRVAWRNVDLIFNFPRGFIFRGTNQATATTSARQATLSIGDVAPGQTGEFHVRGQLIGEQNETTTASADILVTPENFPSGRFRKSTLLATNITSLPIGLNLDVPKEATSSERIVGKVNIVNLSNQPLQNVYLKLKPGTNIEIDPADRDFSPNFSSAASHWLVQSLQPLDSLSFNVVFYVQGQPGETRNFEFEVGIKQDNEEFTQRLLTHVISVTASEVLIQQLLNGSSDPIVIATDEEVSGEIKYNNVGTVGLKDVIIKVAFEGIGFNPRSLKIVGGSYDPSTQTITWSAATVPELAVVQPKTSGIIAYKFTIPKASEFPLAGNGSKDNVIVSVATFDSPDIPTPIGSPKQVISDRSIVSVKTDLLLEATALYDDGRLGLKSSGPLPPQVGQTTTYTVRFRVGTMLNNVSQVRLQATLPDGVSYTGQSYKTDGDLNFNQRTGEITWNLPYVDGGIGRAQPPHELHLQVSITPGEDKIDKIITFLNRASVEAVDEFVDQAVAENLTSFPDTSTAAPNAGTVR